MYKRKPGYELKKGASGEMRWHKKPEAKYKMRGSPMTPGFAEARRRFPGMQASPFVPTRGMLELTVSPDEFHGNGERIMLSSMDTLSGKRAHDVIYHGTRYDFQRFNDRPEDRPANTGHWNNSLGNHFAPSFEVADEAFAGGTMYPAVDRSKRFQEYTNSEGIRTGRVIPVTANIRNPLVVHDETALDAYAAGYMMTSELSDKELEQLDYETGYDYGRDAREIKREFTSKALREQKMARRIYTELSPREIYDYLRPGRTKGIDDAYIAVIEAGRRFKEQRLERMGFDGMIYRNIMEGGVGITPFRSSALQYVEPGTRRGARDILENDRPKNARADEYIEYDREVERTLADFAKQEEVFPRSERGQIKEDSPFATINTMRRNYNALLDRSGGTRTASLDQLFNQIKRTRGSDNV